MDKIKMTKKEFDEYYDIQQEEPKGLATDTSEEKEESPPQTGTTGDNTPDKEEIQFSQEEQKHDDDLEEVIGWDPQEE